MTDSEWSEHLDSFSSLPMLTDDLQRMQAQETLSSIFWEILQVPFLLIIIGSASALASYGVSRVVEVGNTFRYSLVQYTAESMDWVYYCLCCTALSLTALFFTRWICPEAVGSGLPEMKTILGGTIKPVLLSLRLVITKLIGVSLALMAGLSVGKEGPFVQASGAIADLVMSTPAFQNIRRQDAKRLEIIACACASGVAATFGTGYGSILFSIEVTASAYLVKTLPKAFLASVSAMLVFYALGVSDELALFCEEIEPFETGARWWEVVGFVCIGVACGLLGVLFVYIVEGRSKLRNSLLNCRTASV